MCHIRLTAGGVRASRGGNERGGEGGVEGGTEVSVTFIKNSLDSNAETCFPSGLAQARCALLMPMSLSLVHRTVHLVSIVKTRLQMRRDHFKKTLEASGTVKTPWHFRCLSVGLRGLNLGLSQLSGTAGFWSRLHLITGKNGLLKAQKQRIHPPGIPGL